MAVTMEPPTHVLYYFPYSICSIMARYTFAVRGAPRDAGHAMRIEEKSINIGRAHEQYSEHFLCNVNANGEVPVLAPVNGGLPLPDSVDITYAMAETYPDLIPTQHKDTIKDKLAELHRISFFALTFSHMPEVAFGGRNALQKLLAQDDISDTYRAAIEHKIRRQESHKISGVQPGALEEAIQRTQNLMNEVDQLLSQSKTGWILSTDRPTALDAHFVTFVSRVQDVGRGSLVPASVQRYADRARDGPEWRSVMQGRSTVPPPGTM